MAVGIAANTIVFSIINTIFLDPLPVDRPSELVRLRTVDAGARTTDAPPISHLNLVDYAERNVVFTELAGHSVPMTLTILDGGTPQRLFGELVTARCRILQRRLGNNARKAAALGSPERLFVCGLRTFRVPPLDDVHIRPASRKHRDLFVESELADGLAHPKPLAPRGVPRLAELL
jgi:hypothetical protein